jgi:hypothetical protein
LKLTAQCENVGGRIQRYFCGPFWLFSQSFVHVFESTTIAVAGGSWASISKIHARFHLLSTYLFQKLDQVALDFPRLWAGSNHRQRCAWPICGARPPSAELGRQLRRSADAARHRLLGPYGPVPGFSYCGTTVMVVPWAGRGRSARSRHEPAR